MSAKRVRELETALQRERTRADKLALRAMRAEWRVEELERLIIASDERGAWFENLATLQKRRAGHASKKKRSLKTVPVHDYVRWEAATVIGDWGPIEGRRPSIADVVRRLRERFKKGRGKMSAKGRAARKLSVSRLRKIVGPVVREAQQDGWDFIGASNAALRLRYTTADGRRAK